MTLDRWVLLAVAAFALLGLISGAIKQLAQWLALVAAYVFAKPAGAALAPSLGPWLGFSPALAPIGLSALLMLATFVFGALLLRAVLKRVLPVTEKGKIDRLVGLALGGGKGAALAFVLLSTVLSFEEPLAKAGFDLESKTQGSSAVAWTRSHNLFDSMKVPALDAAKKLASIGGDPAALRELMADPKLKDLLDSPELKSALADPELRKLAESGNPAALLADPRVKKLLADPQLAKRLAELQR